MRTLINLKTLWRLKLEVVHKCSLSDTVCHLSQVIISLKDVMRVFLNDIYSAHLCKMT